MNDVTRAKKSTHDLNPYTFLSKNAVAFMISGLC